MSLFLKGLKKIYTVKNIKMAQDKAEEIVKAKLRGEARNQLIRSKYALLRTVGKQL